MFFGRFILTFVLVFAGMVDIWLRSAGGAVVRGQAPGEDLKAVTLIFGAKDLVPTRWDGSVELANGRIEKILGYHFNESARIVGNNAWECSSYPWAEPHVATHPNERPGPYPTLVQPIGVTIEYRGPDDAELLVKSPRGEFRFRRSDVPEAGEIFPLQGTVEIYRTPVVEQVTNGEYEDDYPSLAADSSGNLWLAWQAYKDKNDKVFLRQYANGSWGAPITVTERAADVFMTGAAATPNGVMVIWSERDGSNWHLNARLLQGGHLGKTETITSGEGNNLFHRVITDRTGKIHVAYQSWRRGRSDIYLRTWADGKWLNEIRISDSNREARADDWNPALAADRKGTVWVAWDGYAGGGYNIYLRPVRGGQPGEFLRVTHSNRFHAHASVGVDAQDRVWVAYDEAPENWGKDQGFLLSGGTGLYYARTVRVAVWANGHWFTTQRQPDFDIPSALRRFFHTPRLVADSAGRMWLFVRPRSSVMVPETYLGTGGKWEVFATFYRGNRWSELIPLPDSVGRDEAELQVAPDSNGNLYTALVSDHRVWGGPATGHPPGNHDIMFAKLRIGAPPEATLVPRPSEPAVLPASEPGEREQIARIRHYVISIAGKAYHIYRGDLHRHTDISRDGAGDGSLWDAYRYAMDAAGLDYLAVTDHQSGDQEYAWWRIQKSADMFHVPGYFTALYGTERSVGYPNGHRNLIFAHRGVPVLPLGSDKKSNTGPVLYPFLRKYEGLSSPHTPATNMGTDWRDNDPKLEPIVEIFQGARTSGEHEGAPLSPEAHQNWLQAGGFQPLGFVWKAWAKGYKLGVQASSDHISTHLSYAYLIAENNTREALMGAMRQRHTYAATRNILMDFRAVADGRTFIQGDVCNSHSPLELSARIVGAGPIKKVVLIRDNQYIYSQEPQGETFDVRYKESALTPGEHYYYVRMEQQDGNVAWSSPIWVNYPGAK